MLIIYRPDYTIKLTDVYISNSLTSVRVIWMYSVRAKFCRVVATRIPKNIFIYP